MHAFTCFCECKLEVRYNSAGNLCWLSIKRSLPRINPITNRGGFGDWNAGLNLYTSQAYGIKIDAYDAACCRDVLLGTAPQPCSVSLDPSGLSDGSLT